MKRKILFLLLAYVMSCAVGMAQEDKRVSITATVGVPFAVNPVKDLNILDKYGPSCSLQFPSDAFSVTENLHVNGYGYVDRKYYDYIVTPLKPGIYQVATTVRYGDNYGNYYSSKSISYTITVLDVYSISLPTIDPLSVGDSYTFEPVIIQTGATPTLSWYSSNPTVASVEDGTVTALAEGTATIFCVANNGVSAQTTITVKPLMNYLYSEDFSGGAGAHVTLPIIMKNDADVAGFQFDLTLPEGVTVARKANGAIDAAMTSRAPNHTISGTTLSTGVTRFVTVSTSSNAVISGNDDVVMKVTLAIDGALEKKDYEVKLTNVQLALKGGVTTIYAPDMTLKLTVTSIALGDVNADGVVNVTDAVGIISHILKETPVWFTESVADVNGDGAINVTDVVGVIDMVLQEGNEVNGRDPQ